MRDIDRRLRKAARDGAVEDVVSLIGEGADANAVDDMRVTPMMVATLRGHAVCVQALLPHSDAKAVDSEGCSALIYASQHRRLDCAKALAAFSDIDRKDNEGRGAIDHAVGWGDLEMVNLLETYRLAKREAREIEAASADGFEAGRKRL